MKSESRVKSEILLDFGVNQNIYIQNNPTGVFRSMDNPERIVRIGNAGQSDLLSVVAVEVTPEMVGKKIGVAVFIEVKNEKGAQAQKQKLFQYAVERRGALYIVARSPNDVRDAVKRAFPSANI